MSILDDYFSEPIFKNSLFAFRKAHEVIWKMGYWKYLLIPIFLSVALACVMVLAAVYFGTQIVRLAEKWIHYFDQLSEWMKVLVLVLIILLEIGPLFVVFRNIVILFYGPFLDRLSEKSDWIVTGRVTNYKSPYLKSILRPVVLAFLTISSSVGVFIAGLFLNILPVIGFVLSVGVTFPFQLYFSSIPYIDPYLERRGLSAKASFNLMWKSKLEILAFGLMSIILTSIPVFGWFVGPTYTVIAGIILAITVLPPLSEDVLDQPDSPSNTLKD
ncbi:MAG: EI24 domain-containing protein [Opitutales bacterium]|nr:EI24 domain-containing protein [Opitutales bacterium]